MATTIISRATMDDHIATGRATRWTHALGPDSAIPTAANLDGIWFVVLDGTDDYQPAPTELADVLTHAARALTLADSAITDAESTIRIPAGHVAELERPQ